MSVPLRVRRIQTMYLRTDRKSQGTQIKSMSNLTLTKDQYSFKLQTSTCSKILRQYKQSDFLDISISFDEQYLYFYQGIFLVNIYSISSAKIQIIQLNDSGDELLPSSDGQVILIICYLHQRIKVFHVKQNTIIKIINFQNDMISLQFIDKEHFVTMDKAGMLKLWDMNYEYQSVQLDNYPLHFRALSNNGRFILYRNCSNKRTIIFDLKNLKVVSKFQSKNTSLQYVADDRFIVQIWFFGYSFLSVDQETGMPNGEWSQEFDISPENIILESGCCHRRGHLMLGMKGNRITLTRVDYSNNNK